VKETNFKYNNMKRKLNISMFGVLSPMWIAVLVMLSGCSKEFVFGTSSVAPAAEGSVKVSQDHNDNYEIDLSVIRLVDPGRLTPPKNYYVTWMMTQANGSKNIGQLKTSSGFMSKTLKSSLETVTSFQPVGFFITAENDVNIQYPSEDVILRTSN